MSDIETTPTSFSGTLPIEARTVFRLSSAIFYLIGLVITGGLVAAALYFDWPTWLQYTMYALLAIDLIYSVIDIVVFQESTIRPRPARPAATKVRLADDHDWNGGRVSRHLCNRGVVREDAS